MATMQVPHSNTQGTSAIQRLRLTLAMAEHVERIGARIRAQRETLGLSRRKLAQKMAGVVTENDIYRWERGQHRPGDDKLEALATALEVDVAYFMLPEPQPGTPDLMASLNGDQSQLDRIEAKVDRIENCVRLLAKALASSDASLRDSLGDDLDRLFEEPVSEPGATGRSRRAAGRSAPSK